MHSILSVGDPPLVPRTLGVVQVPQVCQWVQVGTVSQVVHAPPAIPILAAGCSSGLLGLPPRAVAGCPPQVCLAADHAA